MKTLNLLPDAVQMLLPKGKPFSLTFTPSYNITGYTYVAKIIDSANAVIATLTCIPNTVSNNIVIAVSAENALSLETGHRW